jgi:hypothetical protein
MKYILILILLIINHTSHAQPTKAQVIKRLTHTGVTNVDVVKIEKVWERNKYIWIAHATVTKAVTPEKMGGITGISMIIATSAYYDIGANEPYQVLGSESNAEYIGINLTKPDKKTMEQFAFDAAQNNPRSFFISGGYSILGIESIALTNPNPTFITPMLLTFIADAVYVEELTKSTFQKLKSTATFTLHRTTPTSEWAIKKIEMNTMESRYIGDILENKNYPQWRVQTLGHQTNPKNPVTINSTSIQSTNHASTTTPSTVATDIPIYKVGEKVLVEENGKWYPSTVLEVADGKWYIHYDGYSKQYDLWIDSSRIKKQ